MSLSKPFLVKLLLPFLLLTPICIYFPSHINASTDGSFSFIDTGQRLGQTIEGVASITCGDMNNDGFIDLVVASAERDTIIQLYLNDGKGNFRRTNDVFPVTEDPNPLWNFGIALDDFDRDGLLDIATADAWRGVNIYLNSPADGFSWAQAILVPEVNEVKGIDTGDVDGDGDIDIVFGGHNGIPDRGDRVYLNDGNGYFLDSGQRIGNDVTWDTVLGDLDNDGDLDYVSVNRYREHTAKVHINNGTGVFDKTIDIPTTQTDDSYNVKLADLNSDGLIDIVIANSIYTQNGTMSKIFINKGNLEFELTDDKLGEIDCETKWIDVTDIDNDGYYDLVLGNYNIANMIYKNDGHGNFTKTNNGILVNPTTAIAAADFNDDGFMDIVLGHNSGKSDGHYEVYLNNGAGLKSNLPPDPPATLSSKVDSDTVRLSWGPGFDSSGSTLQFTDSGQSIGHLNAARAAVADLDGDGHPDIILGNGEELRQASEIYFNDGNGQFAVSNQTFDAYFLRDMAIGDIDNDGDIDWVVATQGDGGKVLSNDGHGVFQIRQEIGAKEVYVRAVDLGDVDGDGDLDLLYGSIGNRIYLNDGHGVFSDSGQDLKDHYLTQAVRFVDLDGDGDLDFVQGNRIFQDYDSADRIFFNDGNGKFTDSGQRLGQWSTMDVALGDVDLDGDFDLVSICPLGGVNKLYLNDGKGIFTDSGQSLSPSSDINETHSVGFGDIEHDGDLDLVLADWNLGIKLFLNDGHGNYNISDITLGTGETADSVVCDIDLDGDLDILDAKKGGEGSKIYLNNQASTPQSTLKYNVRIGTTPGGNDIVSNIQYGSGQSSTGRSYAINSLKESTYYWSVQAVDAGFKKSTWFPEQQFRVAALPLSPTAEPYPTVEPSPTTTPSPATTPEPTSESITESTPITNTEPASNTAPNLSTSPAGESPPPSSSSIWIMVGIIIAMAGSIALALGIWIVYHRRVKKRR